MLSSAPYDVDSEADFWLLTMEGLARRYAGWRHGPVDIYLTTSPGRVGCIFLPGSWRVTQVVDVD